MMSQNEQKLSLSTQFTSWCTKVAASKLSATDLVMLTILICLITLQIIGVLSLPPITFVGLTIPLLIMSYPGLMKIFYRMVRTHAFLSICATLICLIYSLSSLLYKMTKGKKQNTMNEKESESFTRETNL